MKELVRLTTEYVAAEDRIRLAAVCVQGQAHVMWLTRRLLDRLLPHLFTWLEQRVGTLPCAAALIEFEQYRAQQTLTHQAAVLATQAQCSLVEAVDVTCQDEQLGLVFKCGEQLTAHIGFQAMALHQWLAIVEQAYQRAAWPMTLWPQWLQVNAPSSRHASALLH